MPWTNSGDGRGDVYVPDVIPYAAEIEINSAFPRVRIALTGNCTLLAPSNPIDSCSLNVSLSNATTGAVNVDLDEAILTAGMQAPPYSLDAGQTMFVCLDFDGQRPAWFVRTLIVAY